ncbi:PP2C family protein-serine/threonine phosphatase [Jatrophihabitans sp. YIM 134969]
MRFTTGAATDVGLVRAGNEDSFFAAPHLVAVADGMGGHLGGGTASALAVEALAELARREVLAPDDVVAAVGRANAEVVRRADADPSLHGMGTTLTGVAIVDTGGVARFAVFNVGDSRVYRLDGGALTPVTVDHSEVQALVDAGRLTPEEARVHPARNVITRSIGSAPPPEVDVVILEPVGGDRFVVCSDGLTGEVDDAAIAQVLAGVEDPQAAAEALVAAALDGGGHDNVTVVVVDAVDGA